MSFVQLYACRMKAYLSIIVINDRCRNRIDSFRKVHNGRCISSRHANSRCASSTLRDGLLNSCRIVCHSITNSAKVLDIPEDLVARRSIGTILVEAKVRSILVEGCNALMLDILHPVRRTRAIPSRLRHISYRFLSCNHRRRALVSDMGDSMLMSSFVRNGSTGNSNSSESSETHLDSLKSD